MIISNLLNTINNLQQTCAFRRIPLRSAKAYVDWFLALPNDMYSHSVYFY